MELLFFCGLLRSVDYLRSCVLFSRMFITSSALFTYHLDCEIILSRWSHMCKMYVLNVTVSLRAFLDLLFLQRSMFINVRIFDSDTFSPKYGQNVSFLLRYGTVLPLMLFISSLIRNRQLFYFVLFMYTISHAVGIQNSSNVYFSSAQR